MLRHISVRHINVFHCTRYLYTGNNNNNNNWNRGSLFGHHTYIHTYNEFQFCDGNRSQFAIPPPLRRPTGARVNAVRPTTAPDSTAATWGLEHPTSRLEEGCPNSQFPRATNCAIRPHMGLSNESVLNFPLCTARNSIICFIIENRFAK